MHPGTPTSMLARPQFKWITKSKISRPTFAALLTARKPSLLPHFNPLSTQQHTDYAICWRLDNLIIRSNRQSTKLPENFIIFFISSSSYSAPIRVDISYTVGKQHELQHKVSHYYDSSALCKLDGKEKLLTLFTCCSEKRSHWLHAHYA